MMGNVHMHPALLGKAPCQADFIRVHAQAPSFQAFHRWLEEAVETLRASQSPLPGSPIHFVYVAPDGSGALAGVMVPSRDQVGREFPLAVLLPLDPAVLVQRFSSVPLTLGSFFRRAAELLAESSSLDAATLAARVAELPVPGADAFSRSAEAIAASLRSATSGHLQDLFENGSHWYALHTFLLACDAERKGQPAKGGAVTLECPLSPEIGPALWLELAARRARWRSPPSFIWSDSKLLLTLGAATASTLVWFCKPSPNAVKLWPLRTTSAEAVASARSALPELKNALEGTQAPLEDVWSTLERVA